MFLLAILGYAFLKVVLRSKKDHSKGGPKRVSQAQKEKNKLSPKKQVQGDHEGIKRPKRLKAQTKKHREEKETHGKRLSSQDPQQPSRDADSSRHTVKRKTRTTRKKMIEKENKKQSKRTQAPKKTQRPLMTQAERVSGNQNNETQKREW